MTSVQWTVISFFGVSALVTAGVAFTGCSSGDTSVVDPVDDDSGPTNIDSDSGTTADECTQNTGETVGPIISSTCQAALDHSCCQELVKCFSIVSTDSTKDDCNKYTECYDSCNFMADGTPETNAATVSACEMQCETVAADGVATAYQDIVNCINANADTTNACAQ